MVGYCHLRMALRIFRPDRMADVRPATGSFELPPDFNPLACVAGRLGGGAAPWQADRIGRLAQSNPSLPAAPQATANGEE